MERAKTVKRIKNLEKIRGIIEIAKFDTIQKLAQVKQIKDHHYQMALTTKEIIAFAESKYRISKTIARKIKANLKPKTLWIFITIPSKLIKVSYLHFENMISKEFDRENDQMIAIGDPALIFAKKKRYKIMSSYDDLDESSKKVSWLINNLIASREFDYIKVVANTPRIKEKPYQIFPVETDEFDMSELKQKHKSTKFYYSISEILKNISSTYVANTIDGIYNETKKLFYQEKFAKHESSLKTIDSRIMSLKSNLAKGDRKKETEEMIHITQIHKRK